MSYRKEEKWMEGRMEGVELLNGEVMEKLKEKDGGKNRWCRRH